MGADRARAYAAWARSGRDVSFEPTLAVVRELLPAPPLRLLDVGCGEGRVGAELRARGDEVVGVDAEAAMVELAAANHEAVVAEATALPFGEASFEAALAVHVLMEVEDLDGALAELARVLAPAGVLVAVVEHPFASAAKVSGYSAEERYRWEVTHEGADVGLGGIHRPLGRYVAALERAGLRLDALRELSAAGWDPLSLALRAVR